MSGCRRAPSKRSISNILKSINQMDRLGPPCSHSDVVVVCANALVVSMDQTIDAASDLSTSFLFELLLLLGLCRTFVTLSQLDFQ